MATRCFGLLILGVSLISSQSLVDESEAVSKLLLKTVAHHDRGRLKALVLVRVPWSRVWGYSQLSDRSCQAVISASFRRVSSASGSKSSIGPTPYVLRVASSPAQMQPPRHSNMSLSRYFSVINSSANRLWRGWFARFFVTFCIAHCRRFRFTAENGRSPSSKRMGIRGASAAIEASDQLRYGLLRRSHR